MHSSTSSIQFNVGDILEISSLLEFMKFFFSKDFNRNVHLLAKFSFDGNDDIGRTDGFSGWLSKGALIS